MNHSLTSTGERVTQGQINGGRTKLYRVWINMRRRCKNKNSQFYHRYGGRGIKVCDEWENSFVKFREWAGKNGYQLGLSIDRINNDGNYEPSNCRFVTQLIQSQNRANALKKLINTIPITVRDVMEGYRMTYRQAHHKFRLLTGQIQKTNIDDVDKLVIKDAVANGYMIKEIARYFKKSPQNISGHLRKMGVPQQTRWKHDPQLYRKFALYGTAKA